MKTFKSRLWYAALLSLFFLVANNLQYLTRWIGLRRFMPALAVGGIRNVVQVALCFVAVSLARRIGIRQSAQELGMRAPVRRAFVFSLIASLPMLLAFALTFKLNRNISFLTVAVGCVLAPFAEEILFRSFMFRQLYRRVGLGFWLSSLIPSVLFGLGHLYQSNVLLESIGILAITGWGSIFFCWIFLRWQDNLWAIFGLHSLMNLWWELFAVDHTALGGWLANIARVLTMGIAVLLTLNKNRIWKPLPIEVENVMDMNNKTEEKGDSVRPTHEQLA